MKCLDLGGGVLVNVTDDFDDAPGSDDLFALDLLLRHNAGTLTLEGMSAELEARLGLQVAPEGLCGVRRVTKETRSRASLGGRCVFTPHPEGTPHSWS